MLARQISAGELHNCGILVDGTIECWGSNYNGESDSPSGTFKQVSAGFGCSCGIRTGGLVECWGERCPASLPEQSYVQVAVGGEDDVCGLTDDGEVLCSLYEY